MDNIRNRVRQAMEWLKDNRLFNSNRVIAEKMGYNPSVVSQVITGKSKVTERFCQKPVQHIPAPEFRLDMEREWEHDTGDSSTTAGSGSGAAADGPLLIYPR